MQSAKGMKRLSCLGICNTNSKETENRLRLKTFGTLLEGCTAAESSLSVSIPLASVTARHLPQPLPKVRIGVLNFLHCNTLEAR